MLMSKRSINRTNLQKKNNLPYLVKIYFLYTCCWTCRSITCKYTIPTLPGSCISYLFGFIQLLHFFDLYPFMIQKKLKRAMRDSGLFVALLLNARPLAPETVKSCYQELSVFISSFINLNFKRRYGIYVYQQLSVIISFYSKTWHKYDTLLGEYVMSN